MKITVTISLILMALAGIGHATNLCSVSLGESPLEKSASCGFSDLTFFRVSIFGGPPDTQNVPAPVNILIYDDPTLTILSDVIRIGNDGNDSFVDFFSDPNVPPPLLPGAILRTFEMPDPLNPAFASIFIGATTNGGEGFDVAISFLSDIDPHIFGASSDFGSVAIDPPAIDPPASNPEPGSILLLGSGLIGLGVIGRRLSRVQHLA
jgi:hypothetical protein